MGLLNVALELTPVLGSEGRGSVVKMRVGEMLLKTRVGEVLLKGGRYLGGVYSDMQGSY